MAPLLLDAAPREYLGRVMAVFTPVNQLASMLSMIISGWLTRTVLRSFRASFAGVTLNSVSLVCIVAGAMITARSGRDGGDGGVGGGVPCLAEPRQLTAQPGRRPGPGGDHATRR